MRAGHAGDDRGRRAAGRGVPRPCRAAWRRRPARVFSVLPPENATGNFTKIVQRVPVRILLDGDAATLGRLRPGLSVTAAVDRAEAQVSADRRPTWRRGATPAELPTGRRRSSPSPPCASASSSRCWTSRSSRPRCADIGGGLSAGADEIAWVQTSYLIAEIVVIPLSGWLSRVMSTRWLFCVSAAGFTVDQPAVRLGLEHREHDRVPRAAGLSRRLDDPDRVHHGLRLSSTASSG